MELQWTSHHKPAMQEDNEEKYLKCWNKKGFRNTGYTGIHICEKSMELYLKMSALYFIKPECSHNKLYQSLP